MLKAYKTASTPRNGLAALGPDHLVAGQTGKGTMHFWTLRKEQMSHRSFAPEAIGPVKASGNGAFCAAGGNSGSVYIWEVRATRPRRACPQPAA